MDIKKNKKISFADMLKKEVKTNNENIYEKQNIKNNSIEEYYDEEDEEYEIDNNIINADDEYDKLYNQKNIDIKIDLLKFVRSNLFKFFNNTYNTSKYNFQDFMKYCSINYYQTLDYVEKENNKYYNLLLEKEKQKEEEEKIMDEYYN